MNDSLEEKCLEDLLRFYLKRIHGELLKDKKFKEYLKKNEEEEQEELRKKSFEEYYNKIFSYEVKKSIQNYININKFLAINELLKEKSKKIKRYICCFSGDGDLLSQWRAYADDGRGISVGFKKSQIKDFLKELEVETINIGNKGEVRKFLKKKEAELVDIEYKRKIKNSSSNSELTKLFKYLLWKIKNLKKCL